MCLLNFGSLFLAAVLVVEMKGSHLTVAAGRCPEVNAGLCCPLGVEGKRIILKCLLTKTLRFITSIFFDYLLFICFKYSSVFISSQWWIILTCSESCCVGLELFCQRGIWYVRGCSNPISAADPGPQYLLCLYQTCFMLCLSNHSLFA